MVLTKMKETAESYMG